MSEEKVEGAAPVAETPKQESSIEKYNQHTTTPVRPGDVVQARSFWDTPAPKVPETKAEEAKTEAEPEAKAEADVPKPEEGTEETKSETESEEPKLTPNEIELSEKFNQVTAKERELREAEEKIKADREEIRKAEDIVKSFKEDPLKALQAMGVDFRDVANQVLNDEKPTSDQRVKILEDRYNADIKAAKEAKEAAEEAQKVAERKALQDSRDLTLSNAKKDIQEMIEANGEKYELIKTRDAQESILDVIAEAWNDHEKALTLEEAADKVEKNLEEDLSKIYGTKKFTDRYIPKPDPEKRSEDQIRAEEYNHYAKQLLQEKYSRTLSNSSQNEKSTGEPEVYRTDEESKEYLANKLRKLLEA